MKFRFAVPIIFAFFSATVSGQEMTPLVIPAKSMDRLKKDPKGDCGSLNEALDFNVKLDFPITNGRVVTEVVSSTAYNNLVFANEDGNAVAKVNYFLRFATAKDRQIVGWIETQPLVTVPEGELARLKSQSILVRHLIDLPPGI